MINLFQWLKKFLLENTFFMGTIIRFMLTLLLRFEEYRPSVHCCAILRLFFYINEQVFLKNTRQEPCKRYVHSQLLFRNLVTCSNISQSCHLYQKASWGPRYHSPIPHRFSFGIFETISKSWKPAFSEYEITAYTWAFWLAARDKANLRGSRAALITIFDKTVHCNTSAQYGRRALKVG